MAGTILQRILSRTRLTDTFQSSDSAVEPIIMVAQDQPPTQDLSPNHIHRPSLEDRQRHKRPSLTKATNPTQNKEIDLVVTRADRMPNARKESYASVREESDIPQSFRSRKFSYATSSSPETLPYHPGLLRRSSLWLDGSAVQKDEFALLDDSDATLSETLSETSSLLDLDVIEEVKPTATLETLPDEILDLIFYRVQADGAVENELRPRADLFSLIFTSKAIHDAALRVMYRHVMIYRSKTFHKLNTSLGNDANLGKLIQCLDFSHYSQMGYGRSRGQTTQTPYLTPQTLHACLKTTTNLQAFLVHEHVDDELDENVLTTLFGIETLKAVDFCSCSSNGFVNALTNVVDTLPMQIPLKKLSLHECTTLKPGVFEAILPRLSQLTHLDLAHTMVTDKALMSIPHTARITHLNLERCTQITGSTLARFLTEHPAVKDSLIYLNVMADAGRYRLLSDEDITHMLPGLPSTLRSLNLGGARINSCHVHHLRRLATHLEELGLRGANLSLSGDITRILSLPSEPNKPLEDHPEWRHTIRYIDLSNVSSVSQMSLSYAPVSIRDSHSLPLEVIELSDGVLTELTKRSKNVKNAEWKVSELGRRGWYVRQPCSLPVGATLDDGHRAWKMGARWWGMRKIPMVEQKVGGMYGYFMFKRN